MGWDGMMTGLAWASLLVQQQCGGGVKIAPQIVDERRVWTHVRA